MDAAVIKLDSLADAIGPAAQNHDLPLSGGPPLIIAAIIRRVIVRCVGLELRRTGINQPIAGHKAEAFALGANCLLGLLGQMGDLLVGEPERFGFG